MKLQNMNDLFLDILNKRDLSRAGHLFEIDDKLIQSDLSQLINQIEKISSAHDFNQKINDQRVVEICLTRIISAIRDTGTVEENSKALISLLESCLQHDLKTSPKKDEYPPHALIASDVISCIFLNHDKKAVMQLAVPVAVKLLHRGNKELSRNLSSYLSLASINHAEILADHLSLIIDSIISGNLTLARVLPKIYPYKQGPINDRVMTLVCLLPQCETPEKLALLSLFQLVSKVEPKILLESNLPEFSECLESSKTAYPTLQVFLNIAKHDAHPFLEYVNKVVAACSLQADMLSIAAQFLSIIGKLDIDRACECIYFLTCQLSKSDLSTTIQILKSIKEIAETFPSILPNFLNEILMQTKNSSSNTVQNYLQQLNQLDQQSKSSTTVRVNYDQSNSTFLNSLGNHHNSSIYNYHHASSNLNSIYDSLLPFAQTKSSNFKLNSSNFKLPTSNYNSYKLVNTININPNNDLINRSIPRLHYSNSSNKIGKQLSCSSNGLTNGSKNNHLDHYHHCSADSIATNNQLNHLNAALTQNSSPSSSSNQNMINFRNSRPEMQMMNIYQNDRTNFTDHSIFSLSNKAISGNLNGNILDNPQLQLSSSSSFTNATHHNNFLTYSLNNKSYTLNSANNYYHNEYRDGIHGFCEKHLDKIKLYMERLNSKIPLPARCSIEEKKSKKVNKLQLQFLCQIKNHHCLFNKNNYFTMRTSKARTWIHLMFLQLQSKSQEPLFTNSPDVIELKNCYQALKDGHKDNGGNKNFLTLVTSSFPSAKEQEELVSEFKSNRYFDVFEFNESSKMWVCFMCNNPDKINELFCNKDPMIQGELKEKRAKWKLFRRTKWKLFTLSGLSLSYRDKNSKNTDTVQIGEVRSVRAIGSSRGRNIPKCFEIFTNTDKTYLLKAKNSKNTENWLQSISLSIAMAHNHASRENS